MTAEGNTINLGDFTVGVGYEFDDAALQRKLNQLERDLTSKIQIPIGIQLNPGALTSLKDIETQLSKLAGQSTKTSREQAAAAKSLENQYKAAGQAAVQSARQAAAEAQANTARIREQQAQLRLTTEMASRAAREEKLRSQASINALENEMRSYRNLWQSRRLSDEQVVQAQQRIYQQALLQSKAVDQQSDAYRRLTQVMAGAQRTVDQAQGINTPGGFAYGVTQGITQALGNLGPFGQILEQIVNAGMQAAQDEARRGAERVAAQAGAGLQAGLTAQRPSIVTAAKTTAKAVQDGAEDALDIHSPSRVMYNVGAFAGEGLADGLLSKRDDVARAAKALANSAEANAHVNLANNINMTPAPASTGVPPVAAVGAGGWKTAAATAAALGATTLAVTALSAELVNGTRKAMEFEEGLAEISTLTGKMPGDMDETGQRILKMTVDVRRGFGELKEAYLEIQGASVKGTESEPAALDFLRQSAQLARVTREETKVAADALSSVLNAYELDASQAAKVTDMLWMSVKDGKVSLSEVARSLGQTAGQANSLGVGLDELLASMAFLTTKGIPASVALEYIRSALTNVQKPSQQATEEAQKLGIAFDAQALKSMGLIKFLDQLGRGVGDNSTAMAKLIGDVGGLNAATGILSGGMEGVNRILADVRDSAGSLNEEVAKLDSTAKSNVAEFRSAWERVEILFNSRLLGSFTKFLNEGLTPVLISIGDLTEKLNQVKSPGELHATLKIDWAKDDTTTKIAKFLTGSVTFLKEGVEAQAQGNQKQWDELVKKWNVSKLQVELVKNGLLPREWNPFKQLEQARMIEGDLPKYQKMLADALAKNSAALDGNSKQLALPQPLKGAGPLQPGQQRYDPQTARFFAAIFGQETGGIKQPYSTVNSIGALGKYQVMAQHLLFDDKDYASWRNTGTWFNQNRYNAGDKGRGWDYLALGKDITPDEYLKNPQYQELISQYQMGANLQKQLNKANGDLKTAIMEAAKDWYGRGTAAPGHPTPNQYAESVYRRFLSLGDQPQNTTTPAAVDPNVQLKADIAEGKHLINQYRAALQSGNDEWKAKAKAALDSWKKDHKEAVGGVDTELKQLAKLLSNTAPKPKTAGFGQGYDRLKAQMGDAESLYKLSDNADRYAKALDGISAAALKAAASEEKANGVTAKSRALRDLAGDAASKARNVRSGADREAEAAARDAETAAKNRLKTQQDLQDALLKGKETEARQLLEQAKRNQQAELNLASDNAVKRAEIIRKTTPAILAAEDKLAELKRRATITANQRAYDEAKDKPGADLVALRATQRTLNLQAYATEKSDREKARQQQSDAQQQANQTALQAQQQHERERKALIAQAEKEARQLRYEEADATLNRIRNDNKAELEIFKGSAAEKLALIRRQSQEEFDAAELVARIKRNNALRDNDNNTAQSKANHDERARQINQAYTDTLSGLQNTRSATLRAGTEAVAAEGRAVADLIQRYRDLQSALQDKANAGTVTGDDLVKYGRDLASLWDQAGKAGVKTLPQLKAAHDEARAFGQDAQALSDIVVEWANQLDATSKGTQDYLQSLRDELKGIEGMSEDGLIELYSRAVATRDQVLVQETWDAINRERDRQKAEDAAYIDWLKGQGLISGNEMEYSWGSGGSVDTAKQQKQNTANLTTTFLKLDQETLQDADSVELYEKMLKNLGETSGVTDEQLGTLQTTLKLLQDASGLLPEDFTQFRLSLWLAGRDGKLTTQEIADLNAQLQLFSDNAKDASNSYQDVSDVTDNWQGAGRYKDPVPGGPTAAEKQAEADRLAGLIEEDTLLQGTTEEVQRQADVWRDIINNQEQIGTIGKRQADSLRTRLDLILKMRDAQREAAQIEASDAMVAGPAQAAQDWLNKFGEGKATTAELREGLQGVIDDLQSLADAGDETAKRLIAGLQNTIDATKRLEEAQQQAEVRRIQERAQDAQVSGDFRGQMQASRDLEAFRIKMAQNTFNEEVKTLTEGTPEYKLAQLKLEEARNDAAREGTRERKQIAASELTMFKQWIDQAGSIFKKFSDGQDNALSVVTDWMSMNITAYQKWMSGDIPGAIMTTIEGILNIGDAIVNLDPAFRQWKKNLLEIAAIEKEMIGSKKYGGIQNPYYDQLSQDAASREKLANSKWYQRVWWTLTGSTPQVMEDGAAKLLASASQIFGDMASTINNTLENSLMEAFDLGDFSKIEASFTKTLNTMTAKMALQAIIAASNLKDTLKVFADDAAKAMEDGVITADERATLQRDAQNVRSSMDTVSTAWQTLSPMLPGYGAGAEDAARSGTSGSLFGNAPGVQLGMPQIVVNLPETALKPIADLAGTVGRLETLLDKGITVNAASVQITMPDSFLQANALFSSAAPVFALGANDLAFGAGELKGIPAELRSVFAEMLTYMRTNSTSGGLPSLSGNGGLA